jgi:hypothetical protein
MAVMAAALPYLAIASTAFTFASGMQQASAQEDAGKQQQAIYEMQAQNAQAVATRNAQIITDQSSYQAALQEQQAGQERGASQREALQERQRRDLALSRARAVGAASTGDTLDPTSLNVTGDLYAQGELNALNALWSGESAATGLETQAGLTKYEGKTKADMTRYGGAVDSQLLNYQGQNSAYEGKQAASATRMKTYGTAFGSLAGNDLLNKYAPYKPGVSPTQTLSGGNKITWNTYG